MPGNQFQRMFFAFVTVVITVHAYVFYSLYVVNGNLLMSLTGESSVIRAINAQGGVYSMFLGKRKRKNMGVIAFSQALRFQKIELIFQSIVHMADRVQPEFF